MKNEQKKNYCTPEMKIVELQQQAELLQASNRYGGEVGIVPAPFDETRHG